MIIRLNKDLCLNGNLINKTDIKRVIFISDASGFVFAFGARLIRLYAVDTDTRV